MGSEMCIRDSTSNPGKSWRIFLQTDLFISHPGKSWWIFLQADLLTRNPVNRSVCRKNHHDFPGLLVTRSVCRKNHHDFPGLLVNRSVCKKIHHDFPGWLVNRSVCKKIRHDFPGCRFVPFLPPLSSLVLAGVWSLINRRLYILNLD